MTAVQSEKIRCSVGITAYNEETNIGHLLAALLDQHLHSVEIAEIIVVASACTDRTVPIVREYIILAVPITVYCNEDCRGLCPLCGADRNQGECSCQPVGKLSPFSALRDVKL